MRGLGSVPARVSTVYTATVGFGKCFALPKLILDFA